jgi:hypothetical protein
MQIFHDSRISCEKSRMSVHAGFTFAILESAKPYTVRVCWIGGDGVQKDRKKTWWDPRIRVQNRLHCKVQHTVRVGIIDLMRGFSEKVTES